MSAADAGSATRKTVTGGILLVNKPAGVTSFLVVSKARQLYGLRRVGHCGTLDPFATGLLPIVIGRATRAVAYMDNYDKTYVVRIRFGSETDTMDPTGTITRERELTDTELSELEAADYAPIRAAISSLTELTEQLPPLYSAVKVDGQPLYKYARAGKTVERRSRPMKVFRADTLGIVRDETGLYADAHIHCAKGTYIRALAETAGRTTGLLAHAEALRRVQTGPFTLAEAHSWNELTDALAAKLPLPLLPVEQAFAGYPCLNLTAEQTRRLVQGQVIDLPADQATGGNIDSVPPVCRFADPAGAADDRAKAAKPCIVTVFGPSGFTGLGRLSINEGGQLQLAAERIFADLENLDE